MEALVIAMIAAQAVTLAAFLFMVYLVVGMLLVAFGYQAFAGSILYSGSFAVVSVIFTLLWVKEQF